MDAHFLQTLVEKMPMAYAYHEVLAGPDESPEDYVFLDINPAFEEMTGLKRDHILHRRVTEVVPRIREDAFDWIAFYGQVAFTQVPQEFTRFSDSFNRWYKINVFSPRRGYFVTLFTDVTAEHALVGKADQQTLEINELHRDMETIFNSTHDAMFLVEHQNGQFRYMTTNRIHQRLTGLSLDTLKGKTPFEVFDAAMADRLFCNYKRCVEQGETITYEQTLDFPGGTRIWLTSLTPVFADGSIRYLAGSMTEITSIKEMQKEKDGLLQRLQAMFNEHGAVMLLVDPASGKVCDANPAACVFYGYSRMELLSMRIQEINTLPAEDVAHKYRQALSGAKGYFVFPHRLKDGQVRLVDVYSCPVMFGNEKLLYSIIFDVTDREKYKQELSREKKLLDITLASIGDGVVTTDMRGCITSLNKTAQELTGWSEAEARGRFFSEVFHLYNEQTNEPVVNPVEKVLQTGKIIGLANHTVLIDRQGEATPIADSAAPIRDENGGTFGVVMVFRNVTQEKEHQQRIVYLSYHDQLTDLHNRHFMEELMVELDDLGQMPIALIMGDVNGLKITNDVFGHQTGDRLLQKVGHILKAAVGKSGYVARWGGDEFVIAIPHAVESFAVQVVRQIRDSCDAETQEPFRLSVSLGYAVQQTPGNLPAVLQQAENMMYHQKLLESKSYRNTIINTLLSTLYEKNMETEEHALRLQSWCTRIAETMKLSAAEINDLSLFSILHDIGKVGVPQNILQKPGPLTDEEWAQMRKHPEIGYRIAQNTPELSSVSEFILFHHERWDGKGYPNQLAGENIPLQCRILSVVDAFDAMTNDRVYRNALSPQQAMEELKSNMGTQFDPVVVELFLRVLRDGGQNGGA